MLSSVVAPKPAAAESACRQYRAARWFLLPEAELAGGFYSIWHNCYNTWQMYRKRKADEARAAGKAGGDE